MYQDYENSFTGAAGVLSQDLGLPGSSGAIGTTESTNWIDIGSGNAAKNIGSGSPLQILVTVTEAFTSGGSGATVAIQPALSAADTGTSPEELGTIAGGPIAVASLTAGKQYSFTLPAIEPAYVAAGMRFLGLNFVIATATLTAGMINAAITVDPQTNS
jgi:hypothetical protein